MARIELESVVKRYGAATALAGVSLQIRHRECLVLLGPTGSGKTTLLRLLAGLERPSAGRIRIAGEDPGGRARGARDLALQSPSCESPFRGLIPYLSVAKYIASGLRGAGLARAERGRMVQTTAGLLGLEPLMARRPATLSTGQQQRAALARALVCDPSLLLLDDPFCHLDARLRGQSRRELRRLLRDHGTTTVMSTHDQGEALALADRIAVLHEGRLQQVASPQELHDYPANVFVAGVVGGLPMNLLRGEIRDGVFRAAQVQVEGLAAPDGPVTLGFRGQEAQVLEEEIGFTGCELSAPLEDLEPLGDSVLLWLRHGDAHVVVRTEKGFRAAIGSRMRVIVPPDICHLFDARTGQRLDGPVAATG